MTRRTQRAGVALCSAALLLLATSPARAVEPLRRMEVVQVGEVQYISGGVDAKEREELHERADDFRVLVRFVSGPDAAPARHVDVTLKPLADARRAIELTTAGPLLLFDLPVGRYTLTARPAGRQPVRRDLELLPGHIEELEIALDTAPERGHPGDGRFDA